MKKSLLKSFLLALALFGTSVLRANDIPAIYGSLIYGVGWSSMENPPYGIYMLPAGDSSDFSLVKLGFDYQANGGGTYVDGKYYMTGYTTTIEGAVMDIYYRVFNTADDWSLVREVPQEDISSIPTDLAYDPTTDRIYGCFYTMEGYFNFGILNRLTGKPDVLGALDEQLVALAINREGQMYAVGISGMLYRLQVSGRTFTMSEVGSTGLTVRFAQSATFDLSTGNLYWIANPYDTSKDGGLYKVNTSTGETELKKMLYNGYQMTGIYGDALYAKDNAPAAVKSFNLSYPSGAVNGNITFTLPNKTASGAALSGQLTYHVLIDENKTLTGTGVAGQSVSVAYTFSQSDMHVFSVSAENNVGRGPVEVDYAFVGQDTPRAEEVVMTETATGLKVSWKAPVKGIHDGYINTSNLTYKVVRQPEGVEVYNGKSTSFSENLSISEYGIYWYDVTAYVGTQAGETVSSNKIKLGEACSIPYYEQFNSKDAYDLYTVIDVNNDERIWSFMENCVTYEYNSNKNADDWFITPPLRLDEEKVYRLTFKTWSGLSSYTERLEVAMGTEPTVAGMTVGLLPRFDVTWERAKAMEAIVVPQSSDYAYIGFHGCSEADNYFLYLDDVKIDELTSVHAPDVVTDLSVVVGEMGALNATISFKLPSKAIDGGGVGAITKAEIYRGTTKVKTFESGLTAGATCSYTDIVTGSGFKTYTVYVYNSYGSSIKSEKEVYIGKDIPAPVQNVKVTDMGGGDVRLSWEPASVGENGGYVNTDDLSYTITNIGGRYGNSATVTVTSYDDHLSLSEGEQRLIYYEIAANSVEGTGAVALSDTIFIGDSYALPYKESFARMNYEQGPWNNIVDGESYWRVASYGSADPQDNDGGEIIFAPIEGGYGALISPKISLQDATNPTLSFWLWHNKTSHNSLTVKMVTASGEEIQLDEITQSNVKSAGVDNEWINHRYLLNDYLDKAGDYVQFQFIVKNLHYDLFSVNILALDNISLRSYFDYDLSVKDFSANRVSVKVGETVEFTALVTNEGIKQTSGYMVELYRDGKQVASSKGVALDVGQEMTYTLSNTPNVDAAESSKYWVEVNYPADLKEDNNTTEEIEVTVLPGLPFIDTLVGELSDSKTLTLTWQAPAVESDEATDETVTEDFESYTAFTIKNIGQWTLYDGDKSTTGGIINYDEGDYYRYENVESPMAYQVFNPTEAGMRASMWKARSGEQLLACFLSTSRANDDWLISPMVDGAQTVTFWAKAPDCTYFETTEVIEVLYSTVSTDIADFTKIGNSLLVNSEAWKQYSFDLPEGAKYFALRCVSNNQLVLFIDDITYRPAKNDLSLLGYNVYRNGERLNESLLTTTTHTVPAVVDGEIYQVSVVYNQGESILSNRIVIGESGISDTAIETVKIVGGEGYVQVIGAEELPVSVYTLTGLCIYSGKGDDTVSLAAGVYVVRVATESVKVIVR